MKANKVMNSIASEKKTIKEIFFRIIKRDFSGTSGLMVKNSVFQLSTSFVAKIGALIFTIIIARLLTPELFGLYNLALFTIVIFVALSNFGIDNIIVVVLSKESIRKKNNSKGYVDYFFKLKVRLALIFSLILIMSAYFISHFYYQKPIFYALLTGALYIITINLLGFYSSVLISQDKFKNILIKEFLFQVLRLIIVPLGILILISKSTDFLLSFIILSLSLSTFLSLFYLVHNKPIFYGKKLSLNQKKKVNKLIISGSTILFSGIIFGYVDIIMLGRFVGAEFIGYYAAALTIVTSLIPIVGFGSLVFLPIFSRMNGKRLECAFKKILRIIILLCLTFSLFVILFSNFLISFVFGQNYTPSVNILRLFSILLLFIPIGGIYTTYFLSKNKPQLIAKLLFFSTILNIILNYFFITYLLSYSEYMATIGSAIATIISQGFYFLGLVLQKRS